MLRTSGTDGDRVLAEVADERLVDLHLVGGQPRQVGQRRVAGAEVVDGELDAERRAARRAARRARSRSESARLGDLDDEVPRREPGVVRASATTVSRPGSRSWTRREVDGQLQVGAPGSVAVPGRHLHGGSRSTQRPIGVDVARSPRRGGRTPSAGPGPRTGWCQRSSASTPTAPAPVPRDDGLVVHLELAALQGVRRSPRARAVARTSLVEARRVAHDARCAPRRLAQVHRHVGAAQQLDGLADADERGSRRPRCSP